MLRILIGGKEFTDIRIAILPAGPVCHVGEIPFAGVAGVTVFGVQQFEIFGTVIRTVPIHQVCIQGVFPGTLGDIDPDADFRGIPFNLGLLTAVAHIEVTVARTVVGGIVIVQLQRVVAEADTAAVLLRGGFHSADTVGGDGAVGPEIEGVAIGTENIGSRHIFIPVAGKAIGGLQRGVGGIFRVCTTGDDGDGRDIANVTLRSAVIHESTLAPMVVGTRQRAVLIRLKVHERDRHLADLHADLRRLGLVIGIRGLDRRVHRAGTLSGHERVAVHVANVRIRDTIRFGLDCPVKVAGLIDNVHTVALGNQAKIRRSAKVQRHRCAAERQVGDVRDLRGRRALDGAVHKQTGRHIALIVLRGREQTVGVDRAALGVRDRPGHILRERGLAAVFIHADGRKLDLAVGCVDRIVWRERCMVEYTVIFRRGDQQQGARNRALHAVGRAVADGQVAGALALGGAGSGTAAVEVDRIHHILRIQERNHLIDRHADRVRSLAAVGHKGHDRAVRLDADAVARHEVRIPVVAGLSILDQIKRAGNRFQNIGAVHPGVTDGVGTVLQNRKVRLPRATVACLDNISFHDQVTGRLCRLHVVVVAIHGHDDVAAGGLDVVGSLLRGSFHAPGQVSCLVLAGRGRAAFSIITVIRSLECCLRTRCDRRHKAGDLCIAFLGIQKDIRFRHAVNQRVIRLAHNDFVAGGLDGVYSVRSQRLRGNECQRHQDGQHKSPGSVRESGRFHDSHQLLFCVFLSKFVSSICKKRRDEVFPSLLCALGTYDLSISNRSSDRKTLN